MTSVEHSGGVGTLVSTASHPKGHYFRAFPSHKKSRIPVIYQHIVNQDTGAETVFQAVPVNGTLPKLQHLGGVPLDHAEVQLPRKSIRDMQNAVNPLSQPARRDMTSIAEEVLEELCQDECPASIKNAMNTISACSDIVNPMGNCVGCAETCVSAVAQGGVDVFSDGLCLWDGYDCYSDVSGCYNGLKTMQAEASGFDGGGGGAPPTCPNYAIASNNAIPNSNQWYTCKHDYMYTCDSGQYCCCQNGYGYYGSQCEFCNGV